MRNSTRLAYSIVRGQSTRPKLGRPRSIRRRRRGGGSRGSSRSGGGCGSRAGRSRAAARSRRPPPTRRRRSRSTARVPGASPPRAPARRTTPARGTCLRRRLPSLASLALRFSPSPPRASGSFLSRQLLQLQFRTGGVDWDGALARSLSPFGGMHAFVPSRSGTKADSIVARYARCGDY